MTEPRRLLEGEGTDWEQELLGSAAGDVPQDLEARTLSALGLDEPIGGGPGPAPAGSGSSGSPATGSSGSLMMRAGAVLVVGAAGWLLWSGVKEAPQPVAVGAPSSGVEVALPEPATAQPPEPESVVVEPPAAAPEVSAGIIDPEPGAKIAAKAGPRPTELTAPKAAATPSAAPSQSPPRADTLAREVAALDRARKALAAGNGAGAHAALGAYDREFPRGMMRSEAQLLRVRAHLASGNRAAGVALGKRLIAARPDGFYAKQIRKLIGEPEPAQ